MSPMLVAAVFVGFGLGVVTVALAAAAKTGDEQVAEPELELLAFRVVNSDGTVWLVETAEAAVQAATLTKCPVSTVQPLWGTQREAMTV